jgi:glycosyltransferase involved in cell wall biosynthesis
MVPEFPNQTHAFFWREIEALRALGVEVRIVSTRRPPRDACLHEFAIRAFSETHYVFPPAIAGGARWATSGLPGIARALRYINRLTKQDLRSRVRYWGFIAVAVDLVNWAKFNKIDHIHGHSCADAAHILAIARSLGGPPFSLTLHGDLDVYGIDHREKMREACFVCVVGQHLRKSLLEHSLVSDDRIVVTCMGVNTANLSQLGLSRQSKPLKLHMTTVARLHAAKGHKHALAAMLKCVQEGIDIRYTIAGDGPQRKKIQSHAEELGIADRVSLTGSLGERDVLDLLSAADIFILPSTGIGEAWPVSVMEAMGAGLPVISSIIGATPEMIRSGDDGILVNQGDEAGIANAISMLATDVKTRIQIGQAARSTALRRFDVAVTARILLEAINRSGQGAWSTN